MPDPNLIHLFVEPLNQIDVRYLVSGSVAAMLYGEPRFTNDIDFVVFLRPQNVEKLSAIFPSPQFYVPPIDTILAEMARSLNGQFNIIHTDSGLKADFYTANRDEMHAWAFQHAKRFAIGEIPVSLAPPEYVIVRKLEYYREGGSEKHLRDVRAMLAVSDAQIDHAALKDWIQRRGVEAEWKKVS